jgi:hypothetical protein
MDQLNNFLKRRGVQRPRAYSKTEESPWQKAHSRATMGQEAPLTFRELPIKVRTERIRALITKGLGDGSIAVRLNKEGVACSRAEVHRIRTGREAPDGQGSFDEMAIPGVR